MIKHLCEVANRWAWSMRKGPETTWAHFSRLAVVTFGTGVAAVYLFVLLVDPYDIIPFSLPIERPIVTISQRYMYSMVIRSRRYDSFVIGTSTARLLDPERLNQLFGARFANLSMDSMTAWEQQKVARYFVRMVGPPKVLIIGLDLVWCEQDADRARITFRGFPDWLYGDDSWNTYLNLLNWATVEVAGRLVGYHLGVYPPRIRDDGYGVFTPPEDQYDLARARGHIWGKHAPEVQPVVPAVQLSAEQRGALTFPAHAWLEDLLAQRPATTRTILAFMPTHVAGQPRPGSEEFAIEQVCKARIAAIGRRHAAVVADWRISSPTTRNDANYWDSVHYRLPVADRLAQEIARAARGYDSEAEQTYRLLAGPDPPDRAR